MTDAPDGLERALPELAPGWPHTACGHEPRRLQRRETTCRPPKGVNWIKHRDEFERQWKADVDVEVMADFFDCSPATIYGKANQWHLGRRRNRGGPKKGKKRRLRADPTGQRRKTRLAPTSGSKLVLEPHDPRYRAGITVFPSTVQPAAKMKRLLKTGDNSFKIGRMATKGQWKGMPIFTLTLAERETCPRTCAAWAFCYGNNMPFAERIFDDGTLIPRLWGELAALNAEFPAGFVCRIHVLGDFFSVDYVRAWRRYLSDFPALRVFGFTARRPPDPIANSLVQLVADNQDRFKIRFSGAGYETHCAEVVERAEDAIGIVCPAELNPDRSCATCGLCWTSDRTISFLRH